jgi:hypothetical protein
VKVELTSLKVVERNGSRWFEFDWGGQGDDWWETLDGVKVCFMVRERVYDAEIKKWRVQATEENETRMRDMFSNFHSLITGIRSQLTLAMEPSI